MIRKNLIWHEVEQGTPEWFNLRQGKITSSNCHSLLVNGKNKGLGTGAWSLVYELAGEIVSNPMVNDFDTYATERGKSLEPIAINEYSEFTWRNVRNVGFVELSRYAGTSPDGICVGAKKGVEIKCLMHREHMRVLDNGPDKSHQVQCQWHMFITGFPTWDLVYFHPDMGEKSLLIYEQEIDELIHKRFKEAYEIAANQIARLVSLCKEETSKEG
jgi:hypothetical protein